MWQGQSRKRKRQEVEDATASRIREYMVWLRMNLTNTQIKETHRLSSEEEVNALVSTTASCANAILTIFAEQTNKQPSELSDFDVKAACVLARKTTLGYDADSLVIIKGEKESQYNEWIFNHLKRNNWKACEEVQRKAGELPLQTYIQV